MAGSRRRSRLLASLCAAGLLWAGWAWWAHHRFRAEMQEIESEVVAGRYATACRNLEDLLSRRWDPDGEIAYLLGNCELAQGRQRAADRAWARVGPGAAFSARAIEGRMHILLEAGQFAAAERLVTDAASDPRNDRTALLVLLAPAFSELGRIDEAGRLIERRWESLNASGEGALEAAIKLVQQHIALTLKPTPAEAILADLERASALAPADDRVWLGRANVAIRMGAYDEAERWLDACQRRRPDDVPARLARLGWGIATDRVDVVQRAMALVPALESDPVEVRRLNAWLARHRGDVDTERRELDFLVAADPADVTALARLAELADKEGQPARAAELVRQQAESDRRLARYRALNDRKQPFRDAVELARLAEQLGRRFEARAFLTIALSEDPARDDLRRDLERLGATPATVDRIPAWLFRKASGRHQPAVAPPGGADRREDGQGADARRGPS